MDLFWICMLKYDLLLAFFIVEEMGISGKLPFSIHGPLYTDSWLNKLVEIGGHVVVNVREEYLEQVADYRQFEPYAAEIEAQGRWKLVRRERRSNHFFDKYGVIFTWQVLWQDCLDWEELNCRLYTYLCRTHVHIIIACCTAAF